MPGVQVVAAFVLVGSGGLECDFGIIKLYSSFSLDDVSPLVCAHRRILCSHKSLSAVYQMNLSLVACHECYA